mmetsp:Transcript_86260/g.175229  ORF Transcript_86260/g.175229 Transcript_86260/m.175229 type:complete len:88 (-) Transcript_86260:237-500(-)
MQCSRNLFKCNQLFSKSTLSAIERERERKKENEKVTTVLFYPDQLYHCEMQLLTIATIWPGCFGGPWSMCVCIAMMCWLCAKIEDKN